MRFKGMKMVEVYKYTKNIIECLKSGLKCEIGGTENVVCNRIGN